MFESLLTSLHSGFKAKNVSLGFCDPTIVPALSLLTMERDGCLKLLLVDSTKSAVPIAIIANSDMRV